MNRCWMFLIVVPLAIGDVNADEPIRIPSGRSIRTVDFERHVAPLLTRLECNAGSCHGASDGQGGFRLSLFGHDAKLDHKAITLREAERVDIDDAEGSLFLQKPSLTVEHDGGLRLSRGSWEYELLARWIADGASHDPDSGKLRRVEIEPRESVLTPSNPTGKVRVLATFADGTRHDVTAFSKLRIRDDTIATVARGGEMQRIAPGDTAVIATYNGHPAHAYVLVPRAGSADAPAARTHSARDIDHFISDKLRRLHIEPAPRCSDETFLRRTTLATIGQLPTPNAIRQFVADKSRGKRERQIDSLLSNSLHASMWATRLCEITGSGDFGDTRRQPGQEHEAKWHAWFKVRFEKNMPYDQIASGVLRGTTRDEQSAADFIQARIRSAEDKTPSAADEYANHRSLDLFWQRPKVNEEVDVEAITERVAAAFLGIRIECARCHKHPFDRWTQNDHRSFANLFTQIRFGMSPELRSGLVDALEDQRRARGAARYRIPRMSEVYLSPTFHDLRDPTTQDRLPVRPLGGENIQTKGDRREAFVAWLTSHENPYFAPNLVNRVWARYFGIGLVEPVDAFSAGNPPTHPDMLKRLSRDFIESGYDVRRLEKRILMSDAWQRASTTNASNRSDQHNHSRTYVRVLPADVVVDAISCAIGDQTLRAVEVPGRRSGDPLLDTYFEIFNRPQRKMICDCERSDGPTLRQTMLLLADERLLRRIPDGHVACLTASKKSDQEIIDELFLLTLSRWPDRAERLAAFKHIEGAADRRLALSDVMWSLMNTREFVTNH